MVTMVDPPGGWAYGFPQPLQGDYEKQLREAGYPESDIPLALAHSWYHSEPSAPLLKPEPFPYSEVVQGGYDETVDRNLVVHRIETVDSKPEGVQDRMDWMKAFTGTASDGDDGA